MHGLLKILVDVVVLAMGAGAVGWLLYGCLKRSEDPARLVFKWVLTAPIVWVTLFVLGPFATSSRAGAFIGVPLVAACGLVLTVIWRHNIAGLLANPIASLYDGGTLEPIPRPAYSIAQSKQKKGQYLDSVAEIRKQLERFPTDVEGQLLLAQIQAEDLKDLPAAELTIERFCAQPGHAPQNIAFALYSMADWHLQVGKDREAAQRDLEKIIELLPGIGVCARGRPPDCSPGQPGNAAGARGAQEIHRHRRGAEYRAIARPGKPETGGTRPRRSRRSSTSSTWSSIHWTWRRGKTWRSFTPIITSGWTWRPASLSK